MSWRMGYIADVAYASGVYLETAPAHLSVCASLAGVRAPEAGRPFRYLELGCGTGLGLCLMAAANPHGQFVGVDFNPAHVAVANHLIADARLDNISVKEASFAAFASQAGGEHDLFDYVTAHGVWTWVARSVQLDVVRVLDRCVRPGGLVYVGYNNMAGWASSLTLQRLIFDHAQRVPGDSVTRIKAAVSFALGLRDASPRGLDFSRLEYATGTDAQVWEQAPPGVIAYLAHEYLNESWRPVFPTDVEADLADAKLTYVASASPFSMMPQLLLTNSELEAAARYTDETGRRRLADHLGPQSFRQDIFIRGPAPLPPETKAATLGQVRLAHVVLPADIEFNIGVPGGKLELDPGVYGPLHARLEQGPATVAELICEVERTGGAMSAQELLTVLIGSGSAAAVARESAARDAAADRERTRRFNATMVEALRQQAGMRLALASAKLGSGVRASLRSCLGYLSEVETGDDLPAALCDPGVRQAAADNRALWRALEMI
jgi:SAM-dependent methyltransferase